MSKFLIAASSLALLAGPASALTAPELWADWQATMQRLGTGLTAASEDYSGGTLVLEGVTGTGTFAGTATEAGYGTITLVEQSDGSVRIEVPAEMTQSSTVEIDGQTIESSVTIRVDGLDAVARDDGDVRVYDVDATAISYALDDVSGGEGEGPVAMSMAFTGYESVTRFGADDTYDGTFSGGLALAVDASGPEPFTMAYEARGLAGTITGTVPEIAGVQGPVDLSEIGLEYDFALTHAGSTTALDGTTPEGQLTIASSATSGRIEAAIEGSVTRYSMGSTGVAMTVTPPGLPIPISTSVAETGLNMEIPLAPSDEPGPFALGVLIQDLAIDETLWGLFDPTGQLPREPATLELDMTGTATVLANMMDPTAMETLGGPPMLPNTLDLSTLLLRVAGAELRGNGAVEWADVMSNPLPIGAVTLELDGGFALLDRLVALGFVPPGQVAIARGMAGVVAQPVGEDQLRSELEFTEGGLLANGLPLPF